MSHLSANARLWLDKAEIDYISPFMKAWASFNTWYRDASGKRKDSEGLRYVKHQVNPVRSAIIPLLKPDADSEAAQQFKLLICGLHVALENFQIEVEHNEILERITFHAVCIERGAGPPKDLNRHGINYRVEKLPGNIWKCVVKTAYDDPNYPRANIEVSALDTVALQNHPQYKGLSSAQRERLLDLFEKCNPRPLSNMLEGDVHKIKAGDVTFCCTDQQLFHAVVEVIYSMRNALLHGRLQPHKEAFAAYEPAYRIVMKFMDTLR